MLRRKIINKAFTIILISLLFITPSSANEDSKKCVVYRNGKLMYNPDNPKIHCTTLQILDNFWEENNVNVPNPNKKPEDFTEILTLKDITSNGNVVCKNPSTSNATFTTKDALEGETINGTCNEGYTGTVSATCNKNGNWDFSNNCFGDCNDLEDMYADIDFNDTIETISNDKFAYSKCDNGYDGFKKHKCEDGKLETTNQCRLNINYCQKLTNIENGSITYNNNQAINSIATLKCNTGYKLNGNNSIVCNVNNETNGKWSGELGNCEIIRCPIINLTVDNGLYQTVTTANNSYNTKINGTCNTGYTGTITATCNANGTWTKNGSCTLVRCPTTLTIDNGSYQTITTSNNSYNKTITGTCNTGYTGTITATCNANGEWVKNGSCNIVSGCTEFAFHLDEQYLNVPSTGFANVKMQVWGAQGGVQWDITRNFGGYGYGELDSIDGNKKIRVRIGQYGGTRPVVNYVPIGAGNGGAITNKCYGVTNKTRAGGGGSKIWVDGDFQLQAGGGGGDADGTGNVGAAGGGANIDGSSTWLGTTGGTKDAHGSNCGGQTVKRTSQENGDPNSANNGDSNMSCGGGGGGGYYGGGSCGYALHNDVKHTSGGGGGSGYASSKFKNTGSSTNGTKVGNGFARICWGNSKACDGGAFDHQTSVCDITYSNTNSNAVEIYYGDNKGFFRQGQTVKCNGKSFGLPRNIGSSCFTPGKLHEYASEGNSFQAW